ncbi:MAG: flagellar hook-length control protein FliK [Lachnoclostridium sp.]|jgi:flagellar hook-length control protein FliK|nr:flagellar hook-length control protein FliK [Lachnoclostridium sp.]
MKTQGILLTMTDTMAAGKKQDIRPSGDVFGDLMTNLASSRGAAANTQNMVNSPESLQSDSKNQSYEASQKISANEPSSKEAQNKTTDYRTKSQGDASISEESQARISGEIEDKIKAVLKEALGLSEEDFMDLLEQMGIGLMDFLMPINMETLTIESINMEQLKSLLLEFHGIEDASVILTNPQLEQELAQLLDEAGVLAGKIQEALSAAGEAASADAANNPLLMQDSNAEESMLSGEEVQVEEQIVIKEPVQNTEVAEDGITGESKIIAETTAGKGNQSQSNTEGSMADQDSLFTGTERTADRELPQSNTLINVFAERLNNAYQEAFGTAQKASGPIGNIFDQVVSHIRIRVLPETTSMEMSLNPAHLGRVNISVSAVNGVATATMTVQNEAAKEALQSQLIALKETFAEKGLKVESVEVTVSDFGFKKESNESNESSSNMTRQGRNNGSGTNSSDDSEIGTTEAVSDRSFGTQASRTGSSVIDYTA